MAGLFCCNDGVGTESRIGGLRALVGRSGCTMVQTLQYEPGYEEVGIRRGALNYHYSTCASIRQQAGTVDMFRPA